MSKVKTIQDYETESDNMTVKKSQLEQQMKSYRDKLDQLNSEVIKKGGDAKKEKEKLQICFENYNKVKVERDTANREIKNLKEAIEKMKNSHKPVEKLKGYDYVISNQDIEKNIDKYYNDHCKKEVDDFRKMFEE